MIRNATLVIVVLLAMASCRSGKDACSPSAVLNQTDSVRVETVTITKLDTVTVYVDVPAQSAERQTFKGESHLETDFAESDAWINDDGSLSHSIRNKQQTIATDVAVPITNRETNTENVSHKEVPVYVPTYVEVERRFTSWELFRLKSFWYLVAMSLAGIGWALRKPLISAIKKLC